MVYQVKSLKEYQKFYQSSINDVESYWKAVAGELHWYKEFTKVKQGSGEKSKWFVGGKTNISYNCIDRHLNSSCKNKAAIIWESETGKIRIITYQLLHYEVCRFANVLKKIGVKKGDQVAVYMGMIPETFITMLACSRIGAVHAVIFNGYSPAALAGRLNVLNTKFIITADAVSRKGTRIPLKVKVDAALELNTCVKKVLIFKRFKDSEINIKHDRDIYVDELLNDTNGNCEPEKLDANHPAFSLFTNAPSGELVNLKHSVGGYMVQNYISSKLVFDFKDDDIIWCASDISWISGHSFSLYGALLNGVTTFMYEGVPIYPEPDRTWKIISKFRITKFITSPTILRALYKFGDDWIKDHDLSSLKLIGSKGEPIREETWQWYFKTIGKENVPVINTWLQTETGTPVIASLPNVLKSSPGITGLTLPGIETGIVDINGKDVDDGNGGYLVIRNSFPSVFKLNGVKTEKDAHSGWLHFKNLYFTGDAAVKDEKGLIKVLGRVDDVIKAAGNRVGGSEIERLLSAHPDVELAVVIKRPDEIIGNAIIAFVTLKDKTEGTALMREELRNFVNDNIGAIAKPDELKIIKQMPLTSSGKTDRSALRKIAMEGTPSLTGNEAREFEVLEKLREEYQQKYLG